MLSRDIRAALADSGTHFSPDQQRRLMDLADAAEASEKIGRDADGLIKAMNIVLRSEIRDEFRRIVKDANERSQNGSR
jgi:hypothetical protein